MFLFFCAYLRVPTSSGNHGKPGKSLKKAPCMEKSWNLKKPLNNHGKIMEFCEIIWLNQQKPENLCVIQLVIWLLVVSSFNYFKMHAWSTSLLFKVRTGLKSTCNIQDCLKVLENTICLEKYLKKHSKALESPWILPFARAFNTVLEA